MGELILGMAIAINTIFAVSACMVDAAAETHRILFPVREDKREKQWRDDVLEAWKK